LKLDAAENPSAGALLATHTNTDSWQVAKLSARFVPAEDLSISPSVFYQRERTGDTNTTSLFLGPDQIAKNTAEPGDDTLVLSALNVKYHTGFGELTSVTSFFTRDFDRIQDGQAANSEYLPDLTSGVTGEFNTALANLPSVIALSSSVRQATEEVRLTSGPYDPQGSPVTWLAGLYYSDQHFTFTDIETIPGINALFAHNGYTFPVNLPNSAGPGQPASTDPDFYFPGDYDFYAKRVYDEKQRAVFGELGYNVSPALKFIVGGRYLLATQTLAVQQNYFFGPGPATQSGNVDNRAFTPKYAATYDINPRDTLYATASKGFRLGGDNREPPVSFCGPSSPQYRPDSLWSYELGNKGLFVDNRVSVNTGVFLIKWQDIQQDLDLACSYVTEINAGNAQSYGGEIEIKARATPSLTVGLLGSSTHAILTSEAGALSDPAPIGGAVHKGAYIAGVPRYNAVANAEQAFRLSGGWSGFVRADLDFVGGSHGALSQYEIGSSTLNPDYIRPAYHTLNVRIGARLDAWDFALFCTNALNENKIIQRLSVEYSEQAYRLTPQTVGLSAALRF
jgi:iron complex outermembrane recepter protein